MAETTLKNQNTSTIRLFVGGVVLAFAVLHLGADVVQGSLTPSSIVASMDPFRVAVSAIGGVFSLLLLNLLPPSVKATLVFWRVRDVLPGARAFTSIGRRDERVDLDALEATYGDLPTAPAEQNRQWYRIYRKHESEPGVRDAHRSYLLYRELASVSVLLLGLLFVASTMVLRAPLRLTLLFGVLLGGVYVLAAVSARHSGERMVANVLAAASAPDRTTGA